MTVADPSYRPLGLETDMSNQNFAGARNPDDLLWVQFSVKPIHQPFRSNKEGRPIYEDQVWVEIRTPGNNLLTIERPMVEGDKFRFPRHWDYFQKTHSSEGQQVGTPLSQWPLLRPSQVEELKALKFYTVEQVAFSSDEQISKVGMIAGIAPFAFRERAKLYLDSASNNALAVQQAEMIKKREAEVEELKKSQAEDRTLHAKEMAELRALITMATSKQDTPTDRKGK